MEGIDRRIQKTKKLLSESLIALILEKGYESVTIQEIIDRADVGRSTFYTHYENKEQLLLEGPRNLGVFLFSEGHRPAARTDKATLDFLPLFRHAGQNLLLAKAMLGKKSGSIFFDHLRNHFSEIIREHGKNRFGKSRQEKAWLRYFSTAAASAVIVLLVSWLEDDLPFAAEEMAEKCRATVSAVLASAAMDH